uniref:Uncharacterized protein n=1 Tax=Trichobilharzia regenti TaxID=157069 RepID=A0AA85JY78_TRIRE|nr:unnamed protein product [Trichobilharzia regenti]
MYAPHPITFILDFVRGCYNSIAGEHRNNTFISIMRYGDDETITRGLISATSERFLRHKTLGSHHYLWEKRSTSNSFLESKRYVQLTNISDGESRQSACDWGRVGLAREFADDQTLYGLHNQR